jgi:hypothetical protein
MMKEKQNKRLISELVFAATVEHVMFHRDDVAVEGNGRSLGLPHRLDEHSGKFTPGLDGRLLALMDVRVKEIDESAHI